MKKLLLIGLLLLFACEKEEVEEPHYSIQGEWNVWDCWECKPGDLILSKNSSDYFPPLFVWDFQAENLLQNDSLVAKWYRIERILWIGNTKYELFFLNKENVVLKLR